MKCRRILLLLGLTCVTVGCPEDDGQPIAIACPTVPAVVRVDNWYKPKEPKVYLKSASVVNKLCNGKLGCYLSRLNYIIYNGDWCVLERIRLDWEEGPAIE